MAWSPVITTQLGKKVSLNYAAIASALARDTYKGISFISAHDPILVTIYKDESGYEVYECGHSVHPTRLGRYRGALVELYSSKHSTQKAAIDEFISLVKRPYKLIERQALGACTIIPPRLKTKL